MIEMQKRVGKLESQVKDLHDDLNTISDIMTNLEIRIKRLEHLMISMTIEEDEEIGKENEDGKQ